MITGPTLQTLLCTILLTLTSAIEVGNFNELRNALGAQTAEIVLTQNITATTELTIAANFAIKSAEGETFTIDGGGAVPLFRVDANARFESVVLRSGNALGSGGALYVKYGASVDALWVNFEGNIAGDAGGAVYVRGASYTSTECKYVGNWAGSKGGAVYTDGGSHTATQCDYVENFAGIDGGAVYSRGDWHNATKCNYVRNSAGDAGGAVFIYRDFVTAVDCIYEDNTAIEGSAVCMLDPGSIQTAINCSYKHNNATVEGGAIKLVSAGSLELRCARFAGNSIDDINALDHQTLLSGTIVDKDDVVFG